MTNSISIPTIPEIRDVIREELKTSLKGLVIPQVKKEPAILNAEQACELLGYAKPTLYGKVQRGELPYSRKGSKGKLIFKRDDLLKYVESNRKQTISEDLAEYEKRKGAK